MQGRVFSFIILGMTTIIWDLPAIVPDVPFTIISEKGTCVELIIDVMEAGVYIAEKTGWKFRYMESLDGGNHWCGVPNWVEMYEVPDAITCR